MRLLSFLINKDSFFYTIVDILDGKYELLDIDYANFNFKLSSIEPLEVPTTRSGSEINAYTSHWNVDQIAITLSDNFAEFAYVPNYKNEENPQTEELIKLYIDQVYNSEDLVDFEIQLANYQQKPNSEKLFLASFIRANIYANILKIFRFNNLPIIKSGSNFFNSIRCFEYNYPQFANKRNLLISLHDNSINSVKISNNILSDFSINPLDTSWEKTIHNITENANEAENVILFGNCLNKERLEFIKNLSNTSNVERLGTFNKFSHKLDERHLDFAGRMFQNYSGTIGAIITNTNSSVSEFTK